MRFNYCIPVSKASVVSVLFKRIIIQLWSLRRIIYVVWFYLHCLFLEEYLSFPYINASEVLNVHGTRWRKRKSLLLLMGLFAVWVGSGRAESIN